jgi:hypothetical protein
MFESIELRKVENGFVVIVNNEAGTQEYVFSKSSQLVKFIKPLIEDKSE